MVKMSGQLEYGERAFLQDAEQAIRGDVIRALIELITNSDDAYGAVDGPITVRVMATGDAHEPVEIRVSDAAIGLTAEGLEARLAKLGVTKDASEAPYARGLFGRGARDVASLGTLTFKAIRDGQFSALRIDGLSYEFLAVNEPVTPEHRAELGLEQGQNGFTNIVHVDERIRVPSGAELQRKLAEHAQLRDLARRRDVFLFDGRNGEFHARLQPPALPAIILDEEVPVQGYAPIRVTVRRLEVRSSGSLTPYSRHGLLVKSGVSVFENSWLGLENRPESLFFCGEIEAPQIIQIIHAFDRKESLGGTTRLLKRDRDGLQRDHEYFRALAQAVQRTVGPLFEAVAKEMAAERKQGENLSNAFKVAREALRDQIRRALEEIEDDEQMAGQGDAGVENLVVIPPRRIMAPGSSVTLTVRARPESRDETLNAVIESQSPDQVLEAVVASSTGWADHERLDAIATSVFVTAGSQEGTATIRVRVGDFVARAEIIVLEESEDVLAPPDTLEFEHPSVHVAPSRKRRLILRAPLDFVGSRAVFTVDGVGTLTPHDEVFLVADPTGHWATATLRYSASDQPGQTIVTAYLDDMDATCSIDVKETASPPGPDYDFELGGWKDPDHRAALTLQDGRLLIKVYGLHPSFAGVFGPYNDAEKKFQAEDGPAARAVLAEVIGSELAGYLVERDYVKNPQRLNDAIRVLRRKADLQMRFQAILHKSLRPE
jgi:hypothetical protein